MSSSDSFFARIRHAQSNPSSKKTVRMIVGWVLVVVSALIGIKFLQIKTLMAVPVGMPPAVITVVATKQDHWDQYITTVGVLEAKEGTLITPETLGKVTAIHFESGDRVAAGDALITQDSTVEQVQLRSAQATLENSKASLARGQQLSKDRSISKSELDTLNEKYNLALAAVDNIQTLIDKKTLRAPFAGQLGVRQVQLGAVVDHTHPIVTLQNNSTLYVNFSMPQIAIPYLAVGQEVRLLDTHQQAVDAEVHRRLGTHPHTVDTLAKITAISPEVNNVTRNVQIQATLPNTDHRWRPGMFVDVQLIVASAHPVLIIPITAVVYAPYGNSVYVVESSQTTTQEKSDAEAKTTGNTLKQVFIQTGEQRGDFVVVTSGLKAGDLVASSGVFKLYNGQEVTIDNTLQPNFQLNPNTADN